MLDFLEKINTEITIGIGFGGRHSIQLSYGRGESPLYFNWRPNARPICPIITQFPAISRSFPEEDGKNTGKFPAGVKPHLKALSSLISLISSLVKTKFFDNGRTPP